MNIVVYNYINLSVGHFQPFALWVRIIPNLKYIKKSYFFFGGVFFPLRGSGGVASIQIARTLT